MIVVRDVFQLKFGKAKQALNLLKPMVKKMNNQNIGKYRLLSDLVGNYYTFVLEGTFENMESYQRLREQMPENEWREFYTQFVEIVDKGYRDIWTVEA